MVEIEEKENIEQTSMALINPSASPWATAICKEVNVQYEGVFTVKHFSERKAAKVASSQLVLNPKTTKA